MLRKIPIFYHIPKNAGTYVSDWLTIGLRYYRITYTSWLKTHDAERDSIKRLMVMKGGILIARLMVGDPDYYCDSDPRFASKMSKTEFYIDVQNLTLDLLDNVFLFSVIIEGNGFKTRNCILALLEKYDLHHFLILRDPFSRALSIYHYLKSKDSKHECTHGAIRAVTFQDYILSEQCEDSWLIRNLLNIADEKELKQIHLKKTKKILKTFNVYDIKYTQQAVQEAFVECYGFSTEEVTLRNMTVNKNKTKEKQKINFKTLPSFVKQHFLTRVEIDNQLYNAFIK